MKLDVETLSMASERNNNNERTSINEPYYVDTSETHNIEDLTHRDFVLPNGNILRIHNK